jgi:beta-glucosidase/6-phospho-beta-glucosidase/beta-galactosidase
MPDDPSGLLPAGFLFGVATAGFQVEGGFNGAGEPANNWVTWERTGRVEPSGLACRFWDAPEESLDRAAALGCNAFRLSVEWARIEPADGQVDTRAIGRYAAILDACAERGLQPVATLHHFTHPWWLGEEFWLMPGSPDRFAQYVDLVLPALAPRCRHWVTVNEPNVAAFHGWMSARHPPGRRLAVADAGAVVDNLLTAHVLARARIHRVQPGATVTVNTNASSVYDLDRLLTDLLTARAQGVQREELDRWLDERRAIHDATFPPRTALELATRRLFAACSPYGVTGTAARARLRRPCPRRVVDVVYAGPTARPLDVAGFDWYDPVLTRSLRLPGARTSGGRSWSPERPHWDRPPDPAALGAWCADQHALVPGVPVWVLENGMATRVRNGRAHPRRDGWDRARYLRAHLGAVAAAAAQGAPVSAYFHWSLMDNYEWGTYEPRFGIYGIDRGRGPGGIRWLDTDATGRDAAGAYRRLIAGLRAGDRSVLEAA